MIPTLLASLHDVMSYIVALMGAITCFEFYKTRSKWFVILGSIVLLFFVLILHNQLFSALSTLTDFLAIYRHVITRTGKIIWMKVFIILGLPITLWLVCIYVPIFGYILQEIWWIVLLEILIVFTYDHYHPLEPDLGTIEIILGYINILLLVVFFIVNERLGFNFFEVVFLVLVLVASGFTLPSLPLRLLDQWAIRKENEDQRKTDDVGWNEMQQKNYESAWSIYTLHLRYSANSGDLYYFRGIASEMLRKYKDAITDYNKALELDSKYSIDARKRLREVEKQI